ncbi:MAG: MarC family protein [Methanoregula sp.]|jgi:multiple antibiotic resistance protein
MDQASFFVAFLAALFAIANPVGNIPFFIMYTTDLASPRTRHAVAMLLGPVIFVVLLLCMFFGSTILSFFGISIPAFQIAGAILLLLISISMINGTRTEQVHATTSATKGLTPWKAAEAYIPTILVPLIFPIYIGGGTITVATLYGNEALTGGHFAAAIGVVAIICIMIIICNLASDVIFRVVGRQGLEIVVRIFGIILLGLSIQMFADGAGQMAATFLQTYSQ